MAYDERYRERAVGYKDSGHSFKALQETFGIYSATYYTWKKNKEETGFYAPKVAKRTRRRKIDLDELKKVIEEKPDAYLRELAEKFDCSVPSVHERLKQLKITYKKRRSPTQKNPNPTERNILPKQKKSR